MILLIAFALFGLFLSLSTIIGVKAEELFDIIDQSVKVNLNEVLE